VERIDPLSHPSMGRNIYLSSSPIPLSYFSNCDYFGGPVEGMNQGLLQIRIEEENLKFEGTMS
jgi:hypothetical protein